MDLLESLQESGRKSEKERIELEVQNDKVNPEDPEVISKIIEKLDKWFGKPKWDEASEAWKKFKETCVTMAEYYLKGEAAYLRYFVFDLVCSAKICLN